MKHLLNISESILLTICIFITVFSITIFNKNYIKYEFKKYDYYNHIVDDIKKNINDDISVDVDEVTSDINNYIDNYYEDKIYSSKIKSNNNIDYTNEYNNRIRFIGPLNKIRMYRDIFDVCVLGFIILTGIVFIKTKNKHDINIILIISSILGIIISFIIYYTNNYNDILYKIINDSYHILLGIYVLLLIWPLYKKLYKLIINKKKI